MRSIASRRLMAAVLAGLLAVASAAAAPAKKKATELVEAARLTKEEFVKLISKVDEQVLHTLRVDRIEAGERFVEDDEFRVVEDGHHELNDLRHTLA